MYCFCFPYLAYKLALATDLVINFCLGFLISCLDSEGNILKEFFVSKIIAVLCDGSVL